ncbi:MAG: C40 family peptidase, partial [Deltaproteobacteria bacterium]|nr:C40 family peptidase [Deltaproteobacteria bacterium]
CSNGLTGTLATGRAGQGLLAAHGRSDPPSWVISAPLESASAVASTRIDNAPSSSKSARVRKAQTMQLLLGAYGQTGRPFKAGGKSPQSGFDPAGLLNWIYAQEGVKIPATAADQVAKGQAVTREELRPGDIMVYKTPGSAEYVVGLYTGNGNFILASSKLKVVTETAAFGSDYGPYFVGGRRYLDDPSASPLSDDLKTAAANQAVKVALTAMGDNIPKPANIYGGTRKAKGSSKRKATRRKSRSSAKRG